MRSSSRRTTPSCWMPGSGSASAHPRCSRCAARRRRKSWTAGFGSGVEPETIPRDGASRAGDVPHDAAGSELLRSCLAVVRRGPGRSGSRARRTSSCSWPNETDASSDSPSSTAGRRTARPAGQHRPGPGVGRAGCAGNGRRARAHRTRDPLGVRERVLDDDHGLADDEPVGFAFLAEARLQADLPPPLPLDSVVPRVPLLSGTRLVVASAPADARVLRPPAPGRATDVEAATKEALQFPLDGEPLEALAAGAGSATIVVEPPALPLGSVTNDPRRLAIAAVSGTLEELGVPTARQTLLVAGGLARRVGRREIAALVTPELRRRFHGRVACTTRPTRRSSGSLPVRRGSECRRSSWRRASSSW